MMLRKRQRKYVDNCKTPLKERGNTLGVAPTGAGKTVMMSAIALEAAPKDLPSLTMQHRDELVTQNRDTFVEYAGIRNIRRPAIIDANSKAWDRSAGGWNFGMVQTIINNLDAMPKLGMLNIDEAHHAAAPTYLQIIYKARELNPNILIYGTTATPNRGDRKALRSVFDNCGDHIPIGDIIREGHLVRPRTFVLDIGVDEELQQVKRTAIDFDMKQVESIMNKSLLNDKIIDLWMNGDPERGLPSCRHRQTIVFCSTVQHAKDVTDSFVARGIKAEIIDGRMGITTRRDILARYDRGEIEVLVNVAVLTEGFDHQPTSCVILLRPSSWKSTMTQMIGRGLRKVNPEKYPGVIKDDCIVMDFGTSCLTHGSLEQEVNLEGAGTKMCPCCDATVPKSTKECPICGHEFPDPVVKVCPKCKREHTRNVTVCPCGHEFPVSTSSGGGGSSGPNEILENFVMSEIDILQDSPFKYESFYDGRVMLCFGFTYWAAVIHYQDNRFYAIGAEANNEKATSYKLHVLNSSDNYLMALQSADDYMRTKGNKTDARRVARWLYEPPTLKQLQILNNNEGIISMSKYRASCGIQFKFYGTQMRAVIQGAADAAKEKGFGT